ncbi:Acyl-CoA synthetase (AMP-forming)/AMP-acid ligase II [Thermomonospora echinospora]|uniref:Acyl-CoA synthetase (AMP-forming)/AMP-acid ligase II n=1 Tax=Thermomonospora echinospora TaxID=1992 RepID=A0A1H6DEQ5_9ACTN|nr:FadD3 family acyl-CoA ligase [Thermomonospora echinospora]SEG83701.1 Acyl-CoA synthetase (AMP-forming)/AMP-acid ligase II [Thermomonospora echinospora]
MRWDTIPEMVLSAADRFGDAEAIVDGPVRLGFAELAARVRSAAGAFAAAGVGRGDRVALCAPNSVEWIVAAFGLLTAGGVLVPVGTRLRAEEIADVVVRSRTKMMLVRQGFLGRRYGAPSGVPVIDLTEGFLDGGAPFERTVRGTDVADIVFTSGTTGRPKGVMMNHTQTLRKYSGWGDLAGLREGDRYLVVSPFSHTFGYKAGCIAALLKGATIIPVPVFDTGRVLEMVERERVTMLPGPPTVYHALLSAPGDRFTRGGHDVSSLRTAATGAADIPVELIRRIASELPFASVMTAYGLTEAGTVTCSRPGDSFEDIATTVGTPCEGMQVRIADDGEVLVRGYSVMQGYLDDPEATAQAIDADGWLHTGDLGSMDERGRLRIVGRKKDMFIVGGFNAYPAEIEGFLMEHPAVVQAAVIGVPDERLGEVGKAFVVRQGPVSVEELIAWSRTRMAGYKVPRHVEFLEELPLNATGKVMKDRLRGDWPPASTE